LGGSQFNDLGRRSTIIQQKSKIISIVITLVALLVVLMLVFVYWEANRSFGVDELWQIEYEHRNLEGKTVSVRGDMVFEPLSDFRFNAVYLVNIESPNSKRTPSYAFWFGIGIDGISCNVDTNANLVTCEPFDPSQATTFEFQGTVHLERVGKKEIMWMSDIDFKHSRQLVDGKWEPIPLGEFTFPLERD
jgi:hypothetical protein